MNLERIDFIKIGIVFSGFITGHGFKSSLFIPFRAIWVKKEDLNPKKNHKFYIIHCILLWTRQIFNFEDFKRSFKRFRAPGKFSRSYIRPFHIVHIIWHGELDKVYIILSMRYEFLIFYSKFVQKKSSRSKLDLSE